MRKIPEWISCRIHASMSPSIEGIECHSFMLPIKNIHSIFLGYQEEKEKKVACIFFMLHELLPAIAMSFYFETLERADIVLEALEEAIAGEYGAGERFEVAGLIEFLTF